MRNLILALGAFGILSLASCGQPLPPCEDQMCEAERSQARLMVLQSLLGSFQHTQDLGMMNMMNTQNNLARIGSATIQPVPPYNPTLLYIPPVRLGQ